MSDLPDIEMIAVAMGSSGSSYLEPGGEVTMNADDDIWGPDGELLDEIPDDWVAIDPVESRDAYRDMADFATAVGDPARRERLLDALDGRGAFSRFRDRVHNDPLRLGRTWSRFSDARNELRAIEWLEAIGRLTTDQAEQQAEARTAVVESILDELGALTER